MAQTSVIATILRVKNVVNQALNTRPTILYVQFFVHFYNFRDGLVKSLISNIYCKNIRL
jgi:hypothetical protein